VPEDSSTNSDAWSHLACVSYIYDPEQTIGTVTERSWKYGRDYSFSLGYTHEF